MNSMEGNKKGEDQLKAVWFAAGTAVFMACIERAAMESLFTHWRVWAFLILNLLLLAILFTSKSHALSNENDRILENGADFEYNIKKSSEEFKEARISASCERGRLSEREEHAEIEKKSKEEDNKEEEVQDQLSKEELNERVEAFIAMFRQHLVSDAQGKSCGLHSTSKGIMGKPSRVNSLRVASLSQSNKYVGE